MTELAYVGDELELFAHATNWKRYLSERLSPFIAGDVLEVGAGLGETTRTLLGSAGVSRWLCLEPDPRLYDQLLTTTSALAGTVPIETVKGTLADLPPDARFDTILYIDVLEHIEDDRGEVASAAAALRDGGRLIVLCPAFPFLFTAFDTAIGHYRRYTRASLAALRPAGVAQVAAFYLDSVGLLASLANKLLLKQSAPTLRQVGLWDKFMVPASRLTDPILRGFGKSVVLVWNRAVPKR